MRFRAPRVALVLTAMSAGFLLAGCAAIDDLRTAISQWFESATFPDGREESLRDVPTANTPPEAKQEVANAPRKVAKPARKLPRQAPNETIDHRSRPDGKVGSNRVAIRAACDIAIAHSVS
jgi:hypothetical protein